MERVVANLPPANQELRPEPSRPVDPALADVGAYEARSFGRSRATSHTTRSPALYLRAKPQLRTRWSQIYDRVRHLRVAALVHADRVAMGEADDLGDKPSGE